MLPFVPPFHRIPLKAHLSLAALVLLCVGFAGYSLNVKQTSGLKTAQVDLQSIQSQLKSSNAAGNKDITSKSFTESLPSTVKSEDVMRDMSRLAVEKGMQLDSLKVSPQAATTSELGKMQYNITLKADYYLFKSWLSSLLGRYPTLGVQTLSIKAVSSDNNRQEINVTLQFFVKD